MSAPDDPPQPTLKDSAIGALFGGEAVRGFDLIAMAVILAGVALIALARERG